MAEHLPFDEIMPGAETQDENMALNNLLEQVIRVEQVKGGPALERSVGELLILANSNDLTPARTSAIEALTRHGIKRSKEDFACSTDISGVREFYREHPVGVQLGSDSDHASQVRLSLRTR